MVRAPSHAGIWRTDTSRVVVVLTHNAHHSRFLRSRHRRLADKLALAKRLPSISRQLHLRRAVRRLIAQNQRQPPSPRDNLTVLQCRVAAHRRKATACLSRSPRERGLCQYAQRHKLMKPVRGARGVSGHLIELLPEPRHLTRQTLRRSLGPLRGLFRRVGSRFCRSSRLRSRLRGRFRCRSIALRRRSIRRSSLRRSLRSTRRSLRSLRRAVRRLSRLLGSRRRRARRRSRRRSRSGRLHSRRSIALRRRSIRRSSLRRSLCSTRRAVRRLSRVLGRVRGPQSLLRHRGHPFELLPELCHASLGLGSRIGNLSELLPEFSHARLSLGSHRGNPFNLLPELRHAILGLGSRSGNLIELLPELRHARLSLGSRRGHLRKVLVRRRHILVNRPPHVPVRSLSALISDFFQIFHIVQSLKC